MLQRYVSKELTHFVAKDLPCSEQYQALIQILTTGDLYTKSQLESPGRTVDYNLSINGNVCFSTGEMFQGDVVCFCDIPVSDLRIHMDKYSKFGLSFLKSFLVKKGASPVFYIANDSIVSISRPDFDPSSIKPGENIKKRLYQDIARADHFDEMVPDLHTFFWDQLGLVFNSPDRQRFRKMLDFLDLRIFTFMKPFDSSEEDHGKKNYYMEREWRLWGSLDFQLSDVYRVILPKCYAKGFRQEKSMSNYYGQLTFSEEY